MLGFLTYVVSEMTDSVGHHTRLLAVNIGRLAGQYTNNQANNFFVFLIVQQRYKFYQRGFCF